MGAREVQTHGYPLPSFREIVASGKVTLVYVANADNVADIMTKNLVLAVFKTLLGMLMGEPLLN